MFGKKRLEVIVKLCALQVLSDNDNSSDMSYNDMVERQVAGVSHLEMFLSTLFVTAWWICYVTIVDKLFITIRLYFL